MVEYEANEGGQVKPGTPEAALVSRHTDSERADAALDVIRFIELFSARLQEVRKGLSSRHPAKMVDGATTVLQRRIRELQQDIKKRELKQRLEAGPLVMAAATQTLRELLVGRKKFINSLQQWLDLEKYARQTKSPPTLLGFRDEVAELKAVLEQFVEY